MSAIPYSEGDVLLALGWPSTNTATLPEIVYFGSSMEDMLAASQTAGGSGTALVRCFKPFQKVELSPMRYGNSW
jgi:hypothetical protein